MEQIILEMKKLGSKVCASSFGQQFFGEKKLVEKNFREQVLGRSKLDEKMYEQIFASKVFGRYLGSKSFGSNFCE